MLREDEASEARGHSRRVPAPGAGAWRRAALRRPGLRQAARASCDRARNAVAQDPGKGVRSVEPQVHRSDCHGIARPAPRRGRMAIPLHAGRDVLHHGRLRPHPGADEGTHRSRRRQARAAPPDPLPRRGVPLRAGLLKTNDRREETHMARKLTRQDMKAAAEKYKNWGKWGPNDEIGTLNYTSAEDIVAATRLVRKG